MSSTTPGSEPSRRDDETTDADGEAASPESVEPDAVEPQPAPEASGTEASGTEVHPAGAPADAERIERVEPAEVPPPETEPTPHGDVAFTGTDADAAQSHDEDAAARLDAAVERANADAAASAPPVAATDADAYPEPVPADSVRRDTYVPAATVAAGTAAGAATLAPEPAPAPVSPTPPQAIYVQAPNPPKTRGNRGFGILVGLLATLAFAVLYAGVAFLLISGFGAGRGDGVGVFTEFLARPVFWVPIAAFFLAFALLAAILNKAAWWTWAVFGLFVGVVVYFAYIGGALLTVEAWRLTFEEAQDFIAQRWLDPFAIAALIIARELPIWFGGWVAAHGRTVAERNREAREEYDRQIAAGPQVRQY